jgi:hypothetical protein
MHQEHKTADKLARALADRVDQSRAAELEVPSRTAAAAYAIRDGLA